ncbi:MAG: hypothetical protein JSV84_01370 [Gemmatimonadota bacterium]|nr:MAG: hypothetical protein JSV84_01370 [Gemmatimonadota bacterium]
MNRCRIQKAVFILFVLLVSSLTVHTAVAASQTVRIVVLPFVSAEVDPSLSSLAVERVKSVIVDEGPFQLVSFSNFDEIQTSAPNDFSQNGSLQQLMKKYDVDMAVEGLLERGESDGIRIQIRITTRSSSWRPPTTLSATASTPEYVIPRIENLIRQFLSRYYDEQSMERFFQSVLVPGFGQFREGYKSRAGFFFFGTIGLIAGSFLLSDGNPYDGQGSVEFKKGLNGSIHWYIGDTPVSAEDAEAELQRRADAEDSREKAERRKLFFMGAGIALYAINLYDILKITKRYDKLEGLSLSLHLNPFSPEKVMTINCYFDI